MLLYSLLPVALIANCTTGSGWYAGYNRINKYLVDNVKDDSVHSNLYAVSRWLEQGNMLTFPTADAKRFLALKELIGDDKCDEKSYEIMANNVKAINLLQLIEEDRITRRVDKVVHSVFLAEAHTCQSVYVDRYKQKLESLNTKLVKSAQIFAREIIQRTQFVRDLNDDYVDSKTLFDKFIRRNLSLDSLKHKNCPLTVLREIIGLESERKFLAPVPDELSGKSKVHKSKLKQFVADYLIEPCQYYVNELGPSVFVPARLYSSAFTVNKNDDDDDGDDDHNDEHKFYFGWSCFEICKLFLSNKSILVKNLITAVENNYSYNQ